jgi:thiamine pyrophosphate-dependent acetolactate synthase large subunit-like protein
VTVAEVIADVVRRAGVPRVFAAAGADGALLAALASVNVSVVQPRLAADAVAMAAVAGTLGDPPGVAVIARDDPAVERAVAGARDDQAPTVIVAGASPSRDALLKAVATVGPESAAHWAAHAVQAAGGEPPGPVWLVVTQETVSRPAVPVATALRAPTAPIDAPSVDRVAAAIAGAARPLIVAGRGCRAPDAAPWLRAFAEALPAPVLVTAASRGALPDPHSLCSGLLRPDAGVLRRADLVVALGVDDSELVRAGVTFDVPVVRLGITPSWSPDRADVRGETFGAVAVLVEELAPRLRERDRADWDVAELDRMRRAGRPAPVEPALAALITSLREATPAGTAAVFASALHDAAAVWQAVTPREVLVDERPVAAAAAVALARDDDVVLAFPGADAELDHLLHAPAELDIVMPSPRELSRALDRALERRRACVVIVPRPG